LVAYLISSHQVSFGVFLPLWIWDSFFFVFGNKSEKPQAESCPDGKKVNPILCFVLKWISALHLVLLPRKILSDTLKPVVTIRKGQLNEFGCVIG